MYIEKKPCNVKNYYYEMKCFSNARQALKRTLQALKADGDYTILLPEYIGWSPYEGSGIYDPIYELKISNVFYSLTQELTVDVEKLEILIKKMNGYKVILLVHYFGYIDPNYNKLISLLRRAGVFIIEDAAHALYTHLIDGVCGLGDCIIYSFHKMLPFNDGGAVCTKETTSKWWDRIVSERENYPFYKYELSLISQKRKENAYCWEKLLRDNRKIDILRSRAEYKKQTPQTFPILLNNVDRYEVYQRMNCLGYGIISLYHTMIRPISDRGSAVINGISNRILNLPVHQDISESEIQRMQQVFAEIIQ